MNQFRNCYLKPTLIAFFHWTLLLSSPIFAHTQFVPRCISSLLFNVLPHPFKYIVYIISRVHKIIRVDKNLNAVSLYLTQGPVFTAVIQEWAPWLYQVSNTDLNLIIFYIMRVCLQTISLLKTPASPTAIFSYIVGPIPFQ